MNTIPNLSQIDLKHDWTKMLTAEQFEAEVEPFLGAGLYLKANETILVTVWQSSLQITTENMWSVMWPWPPDTVYSVQRYQSDVVGLIFAKKLFVPIRRRS